MTAASASRALAHRLLARRPVDSRACPNVCQQAERVFGSPDRLPLALATMALCTLPLAAVVFGFCAAAYRQVARHSA